MSNKDTNDSVEFIEDDDFSGEASTRDKIKQLRTKLQACEEEKRQNLEGWQRSKADLINFKRTIAEERPDLIHLGVASVLEDLLPVVDAFYSAMKNKESWERVESNWRTGVEYIYNQLLTTIENNHGELILPSAGDDYDDAQHETKTQHDSDSLKVTDLLRPGLVVKDKVIRPALVTVSD